MSVEFIILIVLMVAILLLVIYFLSKKPANSDNNNQAIMQWLSSMQQTLEKNSSTLSTVLDQNNKNISDTLYKSTAQINQRLETASSVINNASKELGKMNDLGNSIKDLQMLLASPKMRGNLGEEILADMLAQIFPKQNFSLQYSFKSGAKVDAVIKTIAGILCIDAKFPVENFKKQFESVNKKEQEQFKHQFVLDVKKHIKDISAKYILPEEKTVDFAFMYIPSESVFYEIANSQEIIDLARLNRVYPVSPNTLYIHLQTVLLSFQGQKIEENAKNVMRLFKSLQKDYDKMFDSIQVLGRHLTNASSQYSNTFSQMSLMGQKLNQQDLLENKNTTN